MNFGEIAGANVMLGAPEGWDPEKHGECGALPVLREEHSPGVERMLSAWYPTPEEIARIVLGAPVILSVIGGAHPPVSLGVGSVPPTPSVVQGAGYAGLDQRPALCRNRLRTEGKPYPKSGCQACQGFMARGCPHEQ